MGRRNVIPVDTGNVLLLLLVWSEGRLLCFLTFPRRCGRGPRPPFLAGRAVIYRTNRILHLKKHHVLSGRSNKMAFY